MEEHNASIDPEIEKNEKTEPAKSLKELRESRHVSLRSIIEKTKLSPSVIEAIEAGNFHRLPEPVYTRAFLKAYARALDLDSEEILAGYENYLAEIQQAEQISDILTKEKGPRSYRRLILLIVLFVCVLSFAVLYFMQQDNLRVKENGWLKRMQNITALFDTFRRETSPAKKDIFVVPEGMKGPEPVHKESQAPAETEKAETEPVEENKTEPGNEDTLSEAGETAETTSGEVSLEDAAVKPTEEVPGASLSRSEVAITKNIEETPQTLNVEIHARELSWLQIIKDNELPEELFLKAGETVTRDAEKKFDIILGNAGGVAVQFQGKSLGVLGKEGEVVFLTLPDDVKNR